MINRLVHALAAVALLALGAAAPALADSTAEIERDVNEALANLYADTPAARALGDKAVAILVFPDIIKVGLMVGAQRGEGALRRGGRTVAYYRTVSASFGLQAGIQKFGYVLFFMSEDALAYLNRSDGWELGVGPSIVVVDSGMARTMTTTTMKSDIYAFIFDQKGLMAGLGLQGTKVRRFVPEN